jgi:hypothetical protein
MHSPFDKYLGCQRPLRVVRLWALHGLVSDLRIIVPLYTENVALDLGERSAGVEDLITRGGREIQYKQLLYPQG